ncbi:MAG: hypothetical protein IJP96_00355 [Synergistaceae bacterium]|nr:hypothetical protein [Synergistaceae bacterium]MBQ6737990.1 hypothetical protein [Synergistaceae bacterium]MBR0074189.1 hypothetical protein [Synergistaceae bacterium]
MESRKQIFRQKNLAQMSSPEELNDILKVVNPSGWVILLSVFLILTGLFVWCLVGNVEKKINSSVEVSNGIAHFVIKDTAIKSGMKVIIGDTESLIRDVGQNKNGYYIGAADVPEMTDGIYKAKITIEKINPVKLLFN